MRRREHVTDAPLRLCRYDAEEWDHDPEAWYAARDKWEAAGNELPSLDHTSNAPDVPFDPSDI